MFSRSSYILSTSPSSSLLRRCCFANAARFIISSSCYTTPTTTTISSSHQHRNYSFQVFYDKSNPEITLSHAREIKRKEKELGKGVTARYLNALISIAIGHYQNEDYKLARKCALYAHDMITLHRSSTHTMAYFSAVTVAKCNHALAKELGKILDNRMDASNFGGRGGSGGGGQQQQRDGPGKANGSTLIDEDMMQSTLVIRDEGKRFSSLTEMIAHYRSEAEQYEGQARRILDLPDKYFMRTDAQHREENSKESSQTSTDNDKAYSNASNGGSSSNSNNQGGFGMESLKNMRRRMRDEADMKKNSFDATQRRKRVEETASIRKKFTKESRLYRSDMPNKATGSGSRFSGQGRTRRSKGQRITTLLQHPR